MFSLEGALVEVLELDDGATPGDNVVLEFRDDPVAGLELGWVALAEPGAGTPVVTCDDVEPALVSLLLVDVRDAPDGLLVDTNELAEEDEATEAGFDEPVLTVLTGDPVVCVAFVDEELVDVTIGDVLGVVVEVVVEDVVVVDEVVVLDDVVV